VLPTGRKLGHITQKETSKKSEWSDKAVAELRPDFPRKCRKRGRISQQFCCLLLFPYECIEKLDFLQIFTLKVGHILNKFAKAREKYYFFKGPHFFRIDRYFA
jgi:hypothetical protein